jgi:hypothetical protein
MSRLCVASWGGNNKITSEARANDETKADALVALMISEGNVDAFHVPLPTGALDYWVVDPVAKTVSHDQAAEDADTLENNWNRLRMERDALLVSSDWTQYNDSPLTDEVKAEWAVHRETLRDLPENTDDPSDPTWPTPPR